MALRRGCRRSRAALAEFFRDDQVRVGRVRTFSVPATPTMHPGNKRRAATLMDLFPRAFLLVFQQLAVGGFLSLSIPPFHQVSRGYYKSTACIYLLSAVLALAGRLALWWHAGPNHASASASDLLHLGVWAAFVAVAGAYVATLWGDRYVLRARLFAGTWSLGLLGLILAAASYVRADGLSVEGVVYPATFILSALLLGTVSAGMLLGHWYLIDRDLPLAPFQRLLAFYVGCLETQGIVFVVATGLLFFAGSAATAAGIAELLNQYPLVVLARCLVSPIGAGVLGFMIGRTLQIPQTMAATGLFYIAILAVLVGELMGRYLLFRTGIPI